ncbi:MAG: dehydrogenase [Bacteroidetes bacterium]|nr:dehydrogenase [Bacteroidota bacterium]MDA1120499.1 dehydrogenase [Bacteroidota bacterium]
MNRYISYWLMTFSLLSVSCSERRYADSLTTDEALQHFQLREGFKIELYASEPNILDPVEMIFDESGNIYVVEMFDYPYKPEPGKESGRIRMLFDTNGDGKIDSTTVFADRLIEATSVLPWKGGLLVTSAPDILYLKDTNNDNRADIKETLFHGFFENNSEAQITNLRFGIDNWIYASNNGQAGTVTFWLDSTAPALDMRNGDFRFRLDRGMFEVEAGGAQFGQTLDDWGNRFITQNTLHMRQVVIPWRYTHRHPYLPSTRVAWNISDHDLEMFQDTPPPYWRAVRTERRQKQFDDENLDRTEYAEDHFTGASGGTFYGGDAFPKEFYGNIFTGDVAGNLVHRDVLSPLSNSPTFVASREASEKDREFLSSTDPWFRPTNFTIGPDGNLYIIDYYRQHIETPLSITEDLKADMDFYNGSEYGRIYRIFPEKTSTVKKALPNMKTETTEALIAYLTHPNRWWRLHAQRLLLERHDTTVVPSLKKMFINHEDPRSRLHAFYALEGLDALNGDIVKQAMTDLHPGVRKHGAILSEQYPDCLPQLLELVNDQDIAVAFQATLSLGEYNNDEVISALTGIVEKNGQDTWFQMATLSSEAGSSMALLKQLVKKGSFFSNPSPEKQRFLEQFSYITGARNKEGEAALLLKMMADADKTDEKSWIVACITGLTKGLGKSENKSMPGIEDALQKIEGDGSPLLMDAIKGLRDALN